ncbi:Nucleotide-diphospho-sugar transferase family protein [Rhynchospora pubera]|uniref:Nucleotide-diphospho-sugar transferase family protein n=1 Tax=Rhynchospora pubera TaxID=906938 RepID=A0AAV8EPI3_9POAL|nr:Nucleotide-diphospho-sugar transferase family protein [Rhynchospora pubera]
MAIFSRCSETKPIFVAIYSIGGVGILLSVFFIISSLNSSGYTPFTSFGSPLGRKDKTSPFLTDAISNGGNQDNSSTSKGSLTLSNSEKTIPIWKLPTGSKFPKLETFKLTKDMVKSHAKDNVIIVTFGNYAFMDFILNWVKHLTDLHVYNLLVGAMDKKLLEALYWKGVPVFDMGSNMITEDAGWGSPTFHKMGREKVFLINAMLPFGVELLMCDTDMVWLKNPLPYIARYPDADILTSSDQVIPTITDDSLEVWQEVTGAYNIGIFHWRPTEASKQLAKEWKELLLSDEKIWDQNGFNDLVHKVLGPTVQDGTTSNGGLVYTYDGTLKLGILPASIFCSGHTYFVQAMYKQLWLEPYAVHTTFQYAGTDGKRHRLREAMQFSDPSSYYDSPGGYMSFKPRIPKSLLLGGAHTVDSHFALVNYQLKQIRAALAVASLLKRTLVMPAIWCRLDRMWFGHPGILEGSLTRQPFLCPMDHVFEINVMLKDLPEEEFGPRIEFREYSFLQNPSLPKHVKESILEVDTCDRNSSNCNPSNITRTDQQGFLRLPKNSTQHELVQLFSSYKDFKVIQFSSMLDVFQGFSDKDMEKKFRNRVQRYVGIWCCVMLRDPGHIYYDMYWDEKPGWKPEPPHSRQDDHPPWA